MKHTFGEAYFKKAETWMLVPKLRPIISSVICWFYRRVYIWPSGCKNLSLHWANRVKSMHLKGIFYNLTVWQICCQMLKKKVFFTVAVNMIEKPNGLHVVETLITVAEFVSYLNSWFLTETISNIVCSCHVYILILVSFIYCFLSRVSPRWQNCARYIISAIDLLFKMFNAFTWHFHSPRLHFAFQILWTKATVTFCSNLHAIFTFHYNLQLRC